MKHTVLTALRDALSDLGMESPAFIEVEVPRDESFGDLSTPVAMGLARTLRKSPKAIAQEIADSIQEQDMFEGIQVAGPGYINFTFSLDFITRSLRSLLEEGPSFLRTDVGGRRKVQVEFVSANPTGPLHLGHGRGAAVGCALANLLEAAGYEVAREYYVNDAGRQVFLLGESVFSRYQGLLHEEYPFPEEGYRGAYVEEIARAALEDVGEKYRGSSFTDAREHFVDFSLSMMLGEIRQDLEDFGVRFDTWQSERQLYESGTVAHAIEYLKERGLIYESDGAIWFGAMEFGDTKDRVVLKSDGQHTYFASDIAYHLKKIEGGYEEMINVWGADHHGYVPRLEAVIEALGSEREKVMEEVGPDITTFIFLTRRHDSHLSFDLETAKATSAENPVFYVQYANARIHSIFNHAEQQEVGTQDLFRADLSLLDKPEETRLIKKLLLYPMTFEAAALSREPHRITFYLQELAGMFHSYYNRHRIVTGEEHLSAARLALCEAVRVVLKEGLGILGITAPERM
jgi:arginyl-tRNA synthetase